MSSSSNPEIFGLQIQNWTVSDLHSYMDEVLSESGRKSLLYNVNVHALNLCFSDPHFYKVLLESDAIFCDGEGVRQALKYRGFDLKPRITYADWIHQLLPFLQERSYRVFFFGSTQPVMKVVQEKMRLEYPGVNLVGCLHGYAQDEEALDAIKESDAQVLLCGRGMPLQEKWMHKYKAELPCQVYLSGGAVFDYLSNSVSRAPRFMRESGLEWLYRFGLEPRRMFSRYILGNPLFLARVLTSRMPGKNSSPESI